MVEMLILAGLGLILSAGCLIADHGPRIGALEEWMDELPMNRK